MGHLDTGVLGRAIRGVSEGLLAREQIGRQRKQDVRQIQQVQRETRQQQLQNIFKIAQFGDAKAAERAYNELGFGQELGTGPIQFTGIRKKERFFVFQEQGRALKINEEGKLQDIPFAEGTAPITPKAELPLTQVQKEAKRRTAVTEKRLERGEVRQEERLQLAREARETQDIKFVRELATPFEDETPEETVDRFKAVLNSAKKRSVDFPVELERELNDFIRDNEGALRTRFQSLAATARSVRDGLVQLKADILSKKAQPIQQPVPTVPGEAPVPIEETGTDVLSTSASDALSGENVTAEELEIILDPQLFEQEIGQ